MEKYKKIFSFLLMIFALMSYLIFPLVTNSQQLTGEENKKIKFNNFSGDIRTLKPSVIADSDAHSSTGQGCDSLGSNFNWHSPTLKDGVTIGSINATIQITRYNQLPEYKDFKQKPEYLSFKAFELYSDMLGKYFVANGDKLVARPQDYHSTVSYNTNSTPNEIADTLTAEAQGVFNALRKKYMENSTEQNLKMLRDFNSEKYIIEHYPGTYRLSEQTSTINSFTRKQILIQAGNVYINISGDSRGDISNSPLQDIRQLADEILSKLPQQDLSEGVEVYPSIAEKAYEKGLIPASTQFPAKIVFKNGMPNGSITFRIPDDAPGFLKNSTSTGKTITAVTDKDGSAYVYYYFDGKSEVISPFVIPVNIVCGNTSKKAQIVVGLGLTYEYLKPVLVPMDGVEQDKAFAFRIKFKSRYFPRLDVNKYLANAYPLWSPATGRSASSKFFGVSLYAYWLNKPTEAEHDDYYKGYLEITDFIKEARALDNPSFTMQGIINEVNEPRVRGTYTETSTGKGKMPAVILKSEGQHVYQLISKPYIINIEPTAPETPPKITYSETLEPYLKAYPVVISYEQPESLFQSAACAFEAQTKDQYIILESLKLLPAYGESVDKFLRGTSLVCGMAKGEYSASMANLACDFGGDYIDKLMGKDVWDKLNDYQKTSAIFAKMNYKAVDFVRRAYEFDRLPLDQRAKLLQDMDSSAIAQYFPNGIIDNNLNNKEDELPADLSHLLAPDNAPAKAYIPEFNFQGSTQQNNYPVNNNTAPQGVQSYNYPANNTPNFVQSSNINGQTQNTNIIDAAKQINNSINTLKNIFGQ